MSQPSQTILTFSNSIVEVGTDIFKPSRQQSITSVGGLRKPTYGRIRTVLLTKVVENEVVGCRVDTYQADSTPRIMHLGAHLDHQ